MRTFAILLISILIFAESLVCGKGQNAGMDSQIIRNLSCDQTKASYQKIQNAVMPAAKAGNIVALVISRQTMFALGQDMAMDALPFSLEKNIDRDIVRSWITAVQDKSDRGDLFFMDVMSIVLLYGCGGIEKDQERGMALLHKAASQGCPLANLDLGNLINSPEPEGDIQADKNDPRKLSLAESEQMLEYWRQAAEKDNPIALYNLGCEYYYGRNIQRDLKKAVQYWEKSAPMGHAWSQFNLGLSYLKGVGVAPDRKKGLEWIKKAASQGHSRAREYLSYYGQEKDENEP